MCVCVAIHIRTHGGFLLPDWYLRKQCPDLARQQPFPYKLDYELSQNPTHLFQDPPLPGPEPHKILLPLVPLLCLLQHLLGLLELGVHQLLLQVLVFEDFVDMLQESMVGGSTRQELPFSGRPSGYRHPAQPSISIRCAGLPCAL